MLDLDICMCMGKDKKVDCKLKEKCMRYITKSETRQYYYTEVYYKNDKCEYYLDPLKFSKERIKEEFRS